MGLKLGGWGKMRLRLATRTIKMAVKYLDWSIGLEFSPPTGRATEKFGLRA